MHALGGLRFYGDHGVGRPEGRRPGLGRHAAPEDPFGFDMSTDADLRALYLEGEAEDGHGGGDALLLRDVFRGAGDDPLRRAAGYRDGLRSVAVGVGVDQSLATRRPVEMDSLGLRWE